MPVISFKNKVQRGQMARLARKHIPKLSYVVDRKAVAAFHSQQRAKSRKHPAQ